jgi:glycosyltransferase involved in cell wall biosynthesis
MKSKSYGVIKQVILGAAPYDAITSIAMGLGRELGKAFDSKIYSWFEPDVSMTDEVSQIELIDEGSPSDILIYHLSFGLPKLTEWLLQRPEKIILWYHNVTPAEFFTEIDPVFADGLAHGRKEIEILQKRVIGSIADSNFNVREMALNGYESVVVSRPIHVANRLNDVGIDVRTLDQISERFPNGFVLAVSQVLPHKKVEEVIGVLHLLREYHGVDIGLVWAGPVRSPIYMQSIESFMDRLGQKNVYFTDVISEAELATLYRACTAFVSMSQHEGLSVPPLEAMANRTPVIVRGACALAETVGSGGLVLPEDWGVIEFAEVVAQVCRDPNLQSVLRNAGQEWIESYQTRSDISEVIDFIKAIAA